MRGIKASPIASNSRLIGTSELSDIRHFVTLAKIVTYVINLLFISTMYSISCFTPFEHFEGKRNHRPSAD